jgi:hypothetical protein
MVLSMTELLESVISQLKILPSIDQDAIATHLLTELQDEQKWNKSFTETTDRQWDNLAAMVRQEIASEEVSPLDAIFPTQP